jgi:N-carbamoylputrescine amidase
MKIALVQQANSADREANLAKSLARASARPQGPGRSWWCCRNCTPACISARPRTPPCSTSRNPSPGPGTETLSEAAARHGVVIVGSLFERRAAGVYHNTAVVLDSDGRLAGRYRKMHIPDDPGYHEKFYFTPGDLGFEPVDTSVGRLGVLVCWDQWFPEGARLMALAGAELLIYPTAIGWNPDDPEDEQARQRDAWITIQRAHAVANGLPVAACNRTGFEADPSGATAGSRFWGSSFVCGPQGEFLAQAPVDEETVLIADVDLSRAEQVRRIWPYLRDRRIDAYQDLLRRYRD